MDFALPQRKLLIASAATAMTEQARLDAIVERLAADLEAKRAKARELLGDRWVFSPNYNPRCNAHHAPRFKKSASLSVFLQVTGAQQEGRV